MYIIDELKEYFKGYGYEMLSTTYKNAHEPLLLKCPQGHKITINLNNFSNGKRCRICNYKNRIKAKEDEIKKFVSSLNFKYISLENRNGRDKINLICPKGHKFIIRVDHFKERRKCPFCFGSKGELRIKEYLESVNILFIHEKTFNDCKNNNKLKFDFYLPDYEICIEFDGRQHFEPFEYFGGEEAFKAQQKKDEIKNKYCLKNNIKLIRIPYWEFKNIEIILSEQLKDLLTVSP